MKNQTVYTVSELNSTVQQCLASQFSVLWLEGEISNFTRASSGHIYCQLKDSKAVLRAAMFSNKNRLLRFKPDNGMQVLVRGRIGLYEPRGDYQFIIEHMEEAGAGALQRAYEALKEKLQAAGLFDQQHKKTIPAIPKSIGIISSPTGAAVRDAIHVINKRYPQCSIIVYPCMVQGDKADKTIIKALSHARRRAECDVLLLVRGGGSIEDLQAFNSEALAHALFDCDIPIISGVGHEIDFTIADFVADLRAPTPSAAAEYATPEQSVLQGQLQYQLEQLINLSLSRLENKTHQFHLKQQRLAAQSPHRQLQNQAQKLDDIEQGLQHAMQINLLNLKARLQQHSSALKQASPQHKIQHLQTRFEQHYKLLSVAQTQHYKQLETRFKNLLGVLNTVSPLATLERGYSITLSADGNTIQTTDDVSIGDEIAVRLLQGSLHAEVKSKT